MLRSLMVCDWARRLVTSEGGDGAQPKLAALRVYEKLRQHLSAPMGIDAFQSLASRALALAKVKSPRLSVVQVTEKGDLRGLGQDDESGTILISQLLELFVAFLGEATALRLIEDVYLQIEVKTKLNAAGRTTSPLETTNSTATTNAMTYTRSGTSDLSPFEAILLEADQLRNVSERLETIADKHAEMEEGILSVVGNIRNVAAVLDIFTLIRSNAGDSQEDAPNQKTYGYVN